MEVEAEQVLYGWDYKLTSSVNEPLPCVAKSGTNEFKDQCLKGCKWAPDGSCLLTNSEDRTLRLFNLPTKFSSITNWSDKIDSDAHENEWESVLKVKEGGQVYDYCWYPLMSSMDPSTACFLTSAQDNPIHLWDAFTGELRASYIPINYADFVIPARSIAFDPYGEKIYSGYQNSVRIFDVHRPGRECVERKLKQFQFNNLNLTGIISCIAVSPNGTSVYACGSFNKDVGIYLEDGTNVSILQGHIGGVTHLKFTADGMKLYTGGRRDPKIFCWDMRNLRSECEVYDRIVTTNQRVYFDLTPNEKYLLSGCTNGEVRIWELDSPNSEEEQEKEDPYFKFSASTDCINGVSLNPCLPLLATSSGQRYFPDLAEDNDENKLFIQNCSKGNEEFGIRLFHFS